MVYNFWALKEMRTRQLKHSEIKQIRNKLLKIQKNRCPICNNIIYDYEAILDHEHKKRVGGSGLIRGVLCRSCNIFLGKIENNCRRYGIHIKDLPVSLRRISKYLKQTHKPLRHPSEKKKEPKLQLASYNKLKRLYDGKAKFPSYPKSGKLTIKLKDLYKKYNLEPNYYAK